eukprot:RCo026167
MKVSCAELLQQQQLEQQAVLAKISAALRLGPGAQLSAQGVAKVNTELSRGVPLKRVIAELKVAYRDSLRQQGELLERCKQLRPALRGLLRGVRQVPSLWALQMLTEATLAEADLAHLENMVAQGDALEDLLEELAVQRRSDELSHTLH